MSNIFRIFVVGLRREINGERWEVSGERRFNDERLMGRGRKPSLDMWKRMMVRNIPSYILSVEARIKSRQSSAWPWGAKWNTPATKGGICFSVKLLYFGGVEIFRQRKEMSSFALFHCQHSFFCWK